MYELQYEEIKQVNRPIKNNEMTNCFITNKKEEIIAEIITKDPKFAKIYKSFSEYKNTVEKWTKISEYALLQNRYE